MAGRALPFLGKPGGLAASVNSVLTRLGNPARLSVFGGADAAFVAAARESRVALAGPAVYANGGRAFSAAIGAHTRVLRTRLSTRLTGAESLYHALDATFVTPATPDLLVDTTQLEATTLTARADLPGLDAALTPQLRAAQEKAAKVAAEAAAKDGKDSTLIFVTKDGCASAAQEAGAHVLKDAMVAAKVNLHAIRGANVGRLVSTAAVFPEEIATVYVPPLGNSDEAVVLDVVEGLCGGVGKVCWETQSDDTTVFHTARRARDDSSADATGVLLGLCQALHRLGAGDAADRLFNALRRSAGRSGTAAVEAAL